MRQFWPKVQRKCYRIFLYPLMRKLLYYMPVKENRIVFDNFGGKGYGDNPKYIAEQFIVNDLPYELYWLIDNLATPILPDKIKPVKIDSVKALYIRATSKVWVDNVRHLHPVKKKANQIYLQTWHGPFSSKRVEKDAEEELGPDYVREAKYDGEICDAILANSELEEKQYRRAFWLSDSTEILCFGLPRNDCLVNWSKNPSFIRSLKKKYEIREGIYYILYAPTFRDDYSTEGYQLDFERIVKAFSERLQKECCIIVKLHPNAINQCNFMEYSQHVIDGSKHADLQELALATDCVISDYSSSVFDFALIGKPAFLCTLDLEQYEKLRGLLPEFYSFPFPRATTSDQLVDIIMQFDKDEYTRRIEAYFAQHPFYDEGDAAEKTLKWILNKINSNCRN